MPERRPAVNMIGGVPVVAAPDEIDITNAAGLQTALAEASELGHGTFVVDMSATQFCDSAGMHALVQAHKRSQSEAGELLLVVSTPAVLRVFAMTGIDDLIANFPTLEQALAHPSATRSARSDTALAVAEPTSPSPS
jgi:anti-sigma B factor antagonist